MKYPPFPYDAAARLLRWFLAFKAAALGGGSPGTEPPQPPPVEAVEFVETEEER